MKCRHCQSEVKNTFLDLGMAPFSNAYCNMAKRNEPEQWYPLRVLVCDRCWLVQTEDFVRANALFDEEYGYFSGFSTSWLAHCNRYVGEMAKRFSLGASSRVVEVASNDGYLLQYVQALGIPCLGIEPTSSTAAAARQKGIEVREEFFGKAYAETLVAEGIQADLMAANNVLAHVPDINDFVQGFAVLLKKDGVATFEFPHVVQLVAKCQFDTIYHEHFSYLSLHAVKAIFEENGLSIFDAEELSTHGGSLRVFAQRIDEGKQAIEGRVNTLLDHERDLGVTTLGYYQGFQIKADRVKQDFLAYLIEAKRAGRRVAAYGAAAKGNTLLNFSGVRSDWIDFVVDRNPAKQGKLMPGSRIPIVGEEKLRQDKPDDLILLPWNLRQELEAQLAYTKEWNCRLIVPIPAMEIL